MIPCPAERKAERNFMSVKLRRVCCACYAAVILCHARIVLAHPHRPEENVPPHIHEVTGHKVIQGPWVFPLAVLTLLVVFVGLPCLVIWLAMKAVRLLPWARPSLPPPSSGNEEE